MLEHQKPRKESLKVLRGYFLLYSKSTTLCPQLASFIADSNPQSTHSTTKYDEKGETEMHRAAEKGQLDVASCVTVDERTLPRITRNCQLGRLVTTGPLPGSEIYTSSGESGDIELSAITDYGLEHIDWQVDEIPRLSSVSYTHLTLPTILLV